MIYLHWLVLAVYMVVIITTMVAVIMDDRQPEKTLGWLLVLWFMPVVGILLYIFFGQNIRRQHLMSKRSMDQLTKRSMLEFAEQKGLAIPDMYVPLARLFANQDMALPFKGNTVEIYTSGYEFFPALLHEIALANDHIHIDTFIFEDDALGNLIADALIERSLHGVEVRVIYDDVGSWKVHDSFFERMRDAGIDVHAFMPVKFPAFTSKANYRNHRKVCVIDGRTGFIGGMNFALRYVKGTGTQPWRDTHMKISGRGVYALQRAFLVDWYFCDRTLIANRRYYPALDEVDDNDCLLQVVTSGPVSAYPNIMQGYVKVLLQARSYVYMETPYFLPTEQVLFAMRTAALAGVDVRLMTPLKGDSWLIDTASKSYLREAAGAGVKVYMYKGGFNHSKLMVCDDMVSTCGSTNIDFRSFEHNFEANAFFYDRQVAERIKNVFLHDQTQCVLLTTKVLSRSRRQPFTRRLWQSIIRLFSPLL